MYTDEGGYCDGGGWVRLESIIDDGVTYATNLGMYVIIDWHILNDANLMEHLPEAMGFFRKMSAKYANHFNVIYEICDEYNGGASWEIIKQFADSVLPIIRAYDDDAIILVGTPKWSQDTDEVVQNLLGFDNIMYTFHFYAGTHKEEIRSKLIQARDFGIPIFVSEFSICDASGTGGIDYASADTWKELIDDDNISFIAWNLSNKNETSSLIRSSCTEVDYFTEDDLSDTGVYVRNWILMRSSK